MAEIGTPEKHYSLDGLVTSYEILKQVIDHARSSSEVLSPVSETIHSDFHMMEARCNRTTEKNGAWSTVEDPRVCDDRVPRSVEHQLAVSSR